MACENCKIGFAWGGTPTGTESTIANNNTYVTGTSKETAILIVHDIFGWTFNNLRLLADHYAKEANATVYLVDFYGGEIVPPDTLSNPALREKFDLPAFLGRQNKDVRYPEILSVAKALKSQYLKVGGIAYCWGAWALLRLAADTSLIDAITIAHPSLVEKTELDNVKVPLQIVAPEHDPVFTQELKDYANKVVPTLGVPYEYIYFPGVAHGFAAKGDKENKLQRDSLERAKRVAVYFFNEFLH